jgi:hypothetical protein
LSIWLSRRRRAIIPRLWLLLIRHFPNASVVVDISVKQWLVNRGSESVADELWQKVWQWNGGPREALKKH